MLHFSGTIFLFTINGLLAHLRDPLVILGEPMEFTNKVL